LGHTGSIDTARWADRVDLVVAAGNTDRALPVIGPIIPPQAVVIRPDGQAARVGEGPDCGLQAAQAIWFGPASA